MYVPGSANVELASWYACSGCTHFDTDPCHRVQSSDILSDIPVCGRRSVKSIIRSLGPVRRMLHFDTQ